MRYDVVIVGGGPGGLAAALTLGRARRRVLVCDAGAPRNAAATHLHNFVTRDGTPPSEFRAIGRQQLRQYETVKVEDTRVASIEGSIGAFEVTTSTGVVQAARILLATGMVDEPIAIPGFSEAWGHSIFQCPYCHGWEIRDRVWGYLALGLDALTHGFPRMLRNWTDDVVVFTHGAFDIPPAERDRLQRAGIRLEARPIAKLVSDDGQLSRVELDGGASVPCEFLYAHPPQHHVDVVARLHLALDDMGYVQVDPMTRQTSIPGIYAAGDLTTRQQGAIFAASTAVAAAAMLVHDLSTAA